jgi:hypothetical protein
MSYKGNRDTPKKRANQKVKKDPKFSGGAMGEKFKPIPTGTGPFVTPDRDVRTDGQIFEPDVNADPDRTPIGGFGYRDMLKILQAVPRYGGVALGSYLLK